MTAAWPCAGSRASVLSTLIAAHRGVHSEEAETWRGYRRIHRAKDQCWWKLETSVSHSKAKLYFIIQYC